MIRRKFVKSMSKHLIYLQLYDIIGGSMGEYTNLFAKIQQEAKLDMDLTDLVPFGTEGSGNQIKIATIM